MLVRHRIGTVYAEQFPENVRAMILDGAVDPKVTRHADNIAQSGGSRRHSTIRGVVRAADRCALGEDPNKATAAYQSLARPLMDTPMKLADGRVMSFKTRTPGPSRRSTPTLWESWDRRCWTVKKGDGTALMKLGTTTTDGTPTGITEFLDSFQCDPMIDGVRASEPATDALAESSPRPHRRRIR